MKTNTDKTLSDTNVNAPYIGTLYVPKGFQIRINTNEGIGEIELSDDAVELCLEYLKKKLEKSKWKTR